ncbi:MAG: lipid-A-disaccharide synthase [Fidelibacterota bacterium]|nr:MAG: lipid-A-disaccharide synthase [Candidatus Neomarinimicrobiota bacterium]
MSTSSGSDRRFFIVAGEVSGDQHGAALISAMEKLDPSSRFSGIGGTRMEALGMKCLYKAEDMALVGYWEVLRHLPFLLRVMRRTEEFIRDWQPERVILIDYPGFNLRLARRLFRMGIPVTYFISPQLWAWREGRIATIRDCVDQLLVIFPFEVDWYLQRGVEAQFVGHPILEESQPDISRADFLRDLGMDSSQPVLTLFPGSRQQELDRHLQLLYTAAQLVKQQMPDTQLLLGLANGLSLDMIPADIQREVVIAVSQPRLALRYADAAIVASGTATLEGAVWGIPMVVVYRVAPLSWWLGRRLVKLPYAGMVNILSGKEVVPEFLQDRAEPGPIARAILRYFQDEAHRQTVLQKLKRVRQSLMAPVSRASTDDTLGENGDVAGEPGASNLAAKAILFSR